MFRVTLVFVTILTMFVGCSADSESSQNDNGEMNTNDNSTNDNSVDNGANDNETDNGAEDSAPTDQEARAIDTAVDQSVAVASTTGATSDIADVQVVGGRRIPFQSVSCPSIDSDLEGLSITLDFGDGCTPALYEEVTYAGSLTGSISLDPVASFTLSLAEFSANELAIDGSITLSAQKGDDEVAFAGDAALSASAGSFSGDLDWTVDTTNGESTIDGSGTVTDSEDTDYQIEISGIIIDPATHTNFIPEAGVVSLTLPNEEALFGIDSTVIDIEFTTQSPVDGTVQVSINSGEPFEYQTQLTSVAP